MPRLARPFAPLLLLLTLALAAAGCTTGDPPATTATGAAMATAPALPPATVAPTAPPPPATATAPPTAGATPAPAGSGLPAGQATATCGSTPATRAPASPTPTNVAGPPALPTPPPLAGMPAAQTPHYRFYDPEGAHAARIATLAAAAEEIYAFVSARTGLTIAEPIAVTVQTPAPSGCAARGVAFSDGGRIGIFVDAGTPEAQLLAVFAHETVHILHFAAVDGHIPDLTLSEGFANWAILPYWSAWQGFSSFEEAIRAYEADGRLVPLDDPPADCTIPRRDVIYNERASFVGYLIAAYGRERLLAASATGVRAPASSLGVVADYRAIYGKGFDQLIAEWRAWVAGGATGP